MFRRFAKNARLGVLVLCAMAAPRAAAAAEAGAAAPPADNPLFLGWSKFEIGASATCTSWLDDNPKYDQGSRITETLMKKEADSVTMEVTGTANHGVGWKAIEPRQKTILRKWDPPRGMKWLPDEKIEAVGKTFTCKVCGGGDRYKTVWLSDEVPGGVVKMEINTPAGSMTARLTKYSKNTAKPEKVQ